MENKNNVQTALSPELVREFESFYENTCDSKMGRRLRDVLLEYAKTESAKEDLWVNQLLADFDFIFSLIDHCEDERAQKR